MDKVILSSGVSVITCTNKPQFIRNVFKNYDRQTWGKKELILVINKDSMNLNQYKLQARRYKNVSVYQVSEKTSLGKCLNLAFSKTKHGFIAKFDDDDFYAPDYLTDAMNVFARTNADLVGKRTIFTYLEHKKLLLLRFPNMENKFVSLIAGGTIVGKRKVFQAVKFADITLGEDVKFLKVCRSRGFKIYSSDRYNFVCHRRKDPQNHTWLPSDRYLMSTGQVVAKTDNYRLYAARPKTQK